MRRQLYRLVLINLAIFLVTIVALVLARQFIDPRNTLVENVRMKLAHSLELDDPAALDEQLQRMRRRADARLSVYTPEGVLLATAVEPPLPMEVPDQGLFGGYVDVRDDQGRVLARVVMDPSLDDLVRQLSRSLLLLSLLVCGIALLIVIWATRRASAPLETLVHTARRLGSGELDARAGLERDDEIGEVGRAFDEMAARLSLLVRSQRELLTNVSHEFRTPLARMRVVSEMLADGDDVRELLPELDTDIAELERLVEGVLESATLDLRTAAPREREDAGQTIDARELVERVAARLAFAHPERPVELDLELDPPASVEVDLDRLLRAFDNLTDNAHRYSPTDQPITLTARVDRQRRRLLVEVIDHGVGIAAQDLPLIFEPFFRADRSRTRHTGGLGLGLATSNKIIEAEHGTLHVESTVGEGSRFCVELPLACDGHPPTDHSP